MYLRSCHLAMEIMPVIFRAIMTASQPHAVRYGVGSLPRHIYAAAEVSKQPRAFESCRGLFRLDCIVADMFSIGASQASSPRLSSHCNVSWRVFTATADRAMSLHASL
jgi:hypothetical protein